MTRRFQRQLEQLGKHNKDGTHRNKPNFRRNASQTVRELVAHLNIQVVRVKFRKRGIIMLFQEELSNWINSRTSKLHFLSAQHEMVKEVCRESISILNLFLTTKTTRKVRAYRYC